MFIESFKNNGSDYLRLASSVRVTDKSGKKQARKSVVLNLGPLSRFEDGKPDYLKRLRQSFKEGAPLIERLLPYCSTTPPLQKMTLTFQEGGAEMWGHPKYFSDSLLDRILSELGLNALFASLKHELPLEYDLQGFVRLLLFGRVLDPASKYQTALQAQNYLLFPAQAENLFHIYDTLDVLVQNKDKIIRRMNHALEKKMGRQTDLIYYDVTNFYFEIDRPDEEREEEEEGRVKSGIRKMGVCKEERKQPIVQMGLFLDELGLPISISQFPGNTLDQATLRPALKQSLDPLAYPRFILIADRGICSYKNATYLLARGNGYIVSKSIKKSKKEERQWLLDPHGYTWKNGTKDFRVKSRIVKRKEKDEQGKVHQFQEKVVAYWSRKFYEKEKREHQSFLNFIQKLKESPSSFRVTKAQHHLLKNFMKKEVVSQETGEILDSRLLLAQLDEQKLEEFTALMGYYQIVSSETKMEDLEIIDKYHGLTQIEDQFRVLKGDLETRPLFVRTPEHIEAHLLICLIALVLLRLIQRKLIQTEKTPKEKDLVWSYGMSGERVQRALRKWKVEEVANSYYRFCDCDDPDLSRILEAFDLHPPKKLLTIGELKKVKSAIVIF